MRGLTYQMVTEYQRYIEQVHEWEKTREKEFMNFTVDNLLPKASERKALNAIVLKVLEFYTYTDIKESIMKLHRRYLCKSYFDRFVKKQQVDILKLILKILVSMKEFGDSFQFSVNQGVRIEPKNHYFLFCNGFTMQLIKIYRYEKGGITL